jgi:hypothetical protein
MNHTKKSEDSVIQFTFKNYNYESWVEFQTPNKQDINTVFFLKTLNDDYADFLVFTHHNKDKEIIYDRYMSLTIAEKIGEFKETKNKELLIEIRDYFKKLLEIS